jgi:hypothetical protein
MLVRAVLSGVVLRQVRGRGWSEPESLCARAVPYLREGFARGETVVAVVSADVQQVLRAALGDDATRMHWQADNVSYARLGAMFEGFRRFLADQRAAGVALRPLAQNDTAGAPHRMAAYLRIEAMANEVLGAFGYPWACLYDTRAHSPPNAARRPPDPPRRRYDRCWRLGAVSDTAPRAAAGVSFLVPTGPGGSGRPRRERG